MKTRTRRWLAALFAVMLTAGNTLAAAHGCLVDLRGAQHEAAMQAVVQGPSQDCPASVDGALDQQFCATSQPSDDQKNLWNDVPPLAAAPFTERPPVRFIAPPILALLDSPPRVGPSLTILFGRFLN